MPGRQLRAESLSETSIIDAALRLASRRGLEQVRMREVADPSRVEQRPTREMLAAAIDRHRDNIAQVALEFGKDRKQIYRWLAEYGLQISRPKSAT